jgi:hypothetical protein
MKNTQVDQASIIKALAVLTAAPRWVGALLVSEGFEIPLEWMVWWVPLSALLSAAMAGVEGWAFSYVFAAYRNQTDKRARGLFIMAIFSAFVFVLVLAPYIAARVSGQAVSDILNSRVSLFLWSTAVAASTITIVVSVGYAQKVAVVRTARAKTPTTQIAKKACWCGRPYTKQTELAAHTKKHRNELAKANATTVADAVAVLKTAYPEAIVTPALARGLMKKEEPDV